MDYDIKLIKRAEKDGFKTMTNVELMHLKAMYSDMIKYQQGLSRFVTSNNLEVINELLKKSNDRKTATQTNL